MNALRNVVSAILNSGSGINALQNVLSTLLDSCAEITARRYGLSNLLDSGIEISTDRSLCVNPLEESECLALGSPIVIDSRSASSWAGVLGKIQMRNI